MRRLLWICAAGGAIVLAYLLHVATEIHWQSVIDEARPADVIIVMGAAEYRGRPSPVLKARLDHALGLFQRKMAPRIITTGGAGGDPVFTEGEVGRNYLIEHNVPAEAVLVEDKGESTVHSSAVAAEMMRRLGLESCIVVSDGYHIYRVKKMLEFRGLKVYGSPRPTQVERTAMQRRWLYMRQAVGYLLWNVGISI
jgi:uncharacterized SAM-binding protein YcdF (DUF218 family)